MGMKEQLVFPEIQYDQVDKMRGMDIIMVTTAENDADARHLLALLGVPFRSSANAGPGGATRMEF
jgi:large subunit ribosomal protein L5